MRHFHAEDPVGHAIAKVAERQGGVISTVQLQSLGLDRSAIRRRVRRGFLHPLHRGVYAVGHLHLGARGRWFGAVLASGPGAVLSHRPAAAAWELLPVPSGSIDVTVRADGARSKPGIRTHRCSLTPAETTMLDGLPITTAERTLLDVAPLVPFERFQRSLENAQRRGIVDHATLTGLGHTGLPGSPVLRAALAEPEVLTDSVLERIFLSLCRRHGIPAPQVNVAFGRYRLDFYWPEHALVVETDGGTHDFSREDDNERDAELAAAGLTVRRFTYNQVTKRSAWVAQKVLQHQRSALK